jgi:hypothetical protein
VDKKAATQQSTSILELVYLIRAKNKGEMTFAECLKCMSQWAREVIAEHEMGQLQAAPRQTPMQPQDGAQGECQNYQ